MGFEGDRRLSHTLEPLVHWYCLRLRRLFKALATNSHLIRRHREASEHEGCGSSGPSVIERDHALSVLEVKRIILFTSLEVHTRFHDEIIWEQAPRPVQDEHGSWIDNRLTLKLHGTTMDKKVCWNSRKGPKPRLVLGRGAENNSLWTRIDYSQPDVEFL